MGEQRWLACRHARQESPRPALVPAQPLVFPLRPANQIAVDPFEEGIQLRPEVAAVLVDPAPHLGIDRLSQVIEGVAAAEMQPPVV